VRGRTKEYTVKGIIKSKVDETSFRAFVDASEFRSFVGRTNQNVNEVAITVRGGVDPLVVKQNLLASGIGQYARVRVSREALPQALEDIITTFDLLGNAIGSIGLLVSSITIFIVVFVNAITRRKYIGILKGIGVRAFAIEVSYVFQSLVYALAGSLLAIAVIYVFLVPFFGTHPIDFPFSDGILVAPFGGTMARLFILIVATLIAGYIPAWMIIKKNTLDSILGR
jgi:ABC-type antimicrobial peptide transport system permease subunit